MSPPQKKNGDLVFVFNLSIVDKTLNYFDTLTMAFPRSSQCISGGLYNNVSRRKQKKKKQPKRSKVGAIEMLRKSVVFSLTLKCS